MEGSALGGLRGGDWLFEVSKLLERDGLVGLNKINSK